MRVDRRRGNWPKRNAQDLLYGGEPVVLQVTANKDPPKEAGWLKWLTVAALISQIGMLGLVWWGYYFTVRPVFQHQRAEENLAALELLTANERERYSQLQGEYANTLAMNQRAEARARELQRAEESAKSENIRLATLIAKLKSDTEESARRSKLEIERLSESQRLEEFMPRLTLFTLDSAWQDSIEANASKSALRELEALDRSWLDSNELVLASLNRVMEQPNANEIWRGLPEALQDFISEHRQTYSCNRPNIAAMRSKYESQLGEIPQLAQRAANEDIEFQIKQAREQGHELEIDGDYRSKILASKQIPLEIELDSQLKIELSDMKQDCRDKSMQFVGAFNDYYRKRRNLGPSAWEERPGENLPDY